MADTKNGPRAVGAELRRIARRIERVEEERRTLYARRLELFQAGQAAEPKMTHAQLAEHAQVSEEAVTLALRKAKKQAADAAAG